MSRKWFLGMLLGATIWLAAEERLADAPYVLLTGYSRAEIETISYLEGPELEAVIGLSRAPGGFSARGERHGRAAHAIASYLGTRRLGPDITLLFGYLREYVPWILGQKMADPTDIAANYAGVAQALQEAERQR